MEQWDSQGSVGWCLDCEGSRASRADHVQDLGSSCYRMPAQGFPQELMETFYFDIVWVWHVLCAFGARPSWWWTSGHHVAGLQVCKALQGDPPYHRVHFWTNSGWGLNSGEMWNIYAVAVTRRSYSQNKELTQVGWAKQLCMNEVLRTNFQLVYLGQTKLLLLTYPLGSQEYGELFILLFPNMQWEIIGLLWMGCCSSFLRGKSRNWLACIAHTTCSYLTLCASPLLSFGWDYCDILIYKLLFSDLQLWCQVAMSAISNSVVPFCSLESEECWKFSDMGVLEIINGLGDRWNRYFWTSWIRISIWS